MVKFFPFPRNSNLTEFVILLLLVAMVRPHNCAGTDGTMLFHGVEDSADGGDNHLTHLTQAVD